MQRPNFLLSFGLQDPNTVGRIIIRRQRDFILKISEVFFFYFVNDKFINAVKTSNLAWHSTPLILMICVTRL